MKNLIIKTSKQSQEQGDKGASPVKDQKKKTERKPRFYCKQHPDHQIDVFCLKSSEFMCSTCYLEKRLKYSQILGIDGGDIFSHSLLLQEQLQSLKVKIDNQLETLDKITSTKSRFNQDQILQEFSQSAKLLTEKEFIINKNLFMEITKFQMKSESTDEFEQFSILQDKTFILDGEKQGVRSIHFDQKEGPYMSYESYLETEFLPNGQHYPSKKYFMNPKYDAKTRTFTAYIDWSFSPLENGVTRMDYKIIFDEFFSHISKGHRKSLNVYQEIVEESNIGPFQDLYYKIKQDTISPLNLTQDGQQSMGNGESPSPVIKPVDTEVKECQTHEFLYFAQKLPVSDLQELNKESLNLLNLSCNESSVSPAIKISDSESIEYHTDL